MVNCFSGGIVKYEIEDAAKLIMRYEVGIMNYEVLSNEDQFLFGEIVRTGIHLIKGLTRFHPFNLLHQR